MTLSSALCRLPFARCEASAWIFQHHRRLLRFGADFGPEIACKIGTGLWSCAAVCWTCSASTPSLTNCNIDCSVGNIHPSHLPCRRTASMSWPRVRSRHHEQTARSSHGSEALARQELQKSSVDGSFVGEYGKDAACSGPALALLRPRWRGVWI